MGGWSPSFPAAVAMDAGVNDAGATLGIDYGTSATWFVDQSVSSSGAGTSIGTAFKTINEALTEAKKAGNLGGTIAVANGTYREKLDLGSTNYSNGLTIRPYSTHQPVMSGADVVSGWVACDAGDTLLGSAWPNCYKATLAVPTASATNDIGATDLWMHLDGEVLTLAHQSAVELDPFSYLDDDRFLTADSFGVNGSNHIVSVTDADVISLYTEAQLTNAELLLYHSPNESTIENIDSKTGSNQINVTTTYGVQSGQFLYALFNILPNIQPGQWGVNKTSSGGLYTVYYYPRTAGEMSGVFEASVRSQCIYLSNAQGAITIQGMTLKQSAGTGRRHGPLISSVSGGAITRSGSITVRHCILTNAWGRDDGYGNMYVQSRDDCVFENNTFINGAALFGIYLHRSDDTRISKNYFERMGSAAIRVYGSGDPVTNTTNRTEVSFNHMYLCGRNTHSNLINFYQGCDYFLIYGNRFEDCFGFITWQEASNMFIAFNDVPVNPDSGASNQRAIADQNDTTVPPDNVDAIGYLWNNRSVPVPGAETTQVNAWVLGKAAYVHTFAFYNNIIHGGGVDMVSIPTKLVEQKNNLFTAYTTAWAQGADDLDASDFYDNVLTDTYVNTASGNFAYVRGGNAGMRGYDVRSTAIAAAQAIWPSFNFNVDMNGHEFSWDDPFIGPVNPRFRT